MSYSVSVDIQSNICDRVTSFPILLCIAVYERHKKKTGDITFYEHVSAAAERVFDFLPKHIKHMSMYLPMVMLVDYDPQGHIN